LKHAFVLYVIPHYILFGISIAINLAVQRILQIFTANKNLGAVMKKNIRKLTNQNSENPKFLTGFQKDVSDLEYKIFKYVLDVIKTNQCVCRL